MLRVVFPLIGQAYSLPLPQMITFVCKGTSHSLSLVRVGLALQSITIFTHLYHINASSTLQVRRCDCAWLLQQNRVLSWDGSVMLIMRMNFCSLIIHICVKTWRTAVWSKSTREESDATRSPEFGVWVQTYITHVAWGLLKVRADDPRTKLSLQAKFFTD